MWCISLIARDIENIAHDIVLSCSIMQFSALICFSSFKKPSLNPVRFSRCKLHFIVLCNVLKVDDVESNHSRLYLHTNTRGTELKNLPPKAIPLIRNPESFNSPNGQIIHRHHVLSLSRSPSPDVQTVVPVPVVPMVLVLVLVLVLVV